MRIVMLIASAPRTSSTLHRQIQVRQRRRNELRDPTHFAGVDHFVCLHRIDLRCVSSMIHSHAWWRCFAMVETRNDYFLRHAGWRHYPRAGESLHLHGSRHVKEVVTPRKKAAHRSAFLSGFVAGTSRPTTLVWRWCAHVLGYLISTWDSRTKCSPRPCLPSVWWPLASLAWPGDHRRRLLWPRYRQRPIRL